ncbi:MAG: retroviral-like aspartic protease family protein [Hyphomicrobiales bacterium]|nr:retroviral-like aspartic protease family protein [Hyphomicrobiales bacterium]
MLTCKTAFLNMSKAYAALGQFCEATSPIETWIALGPLNRDTSQVERLIAEYSQKGNCGTSEPKRSQRFPLKGGTNLAAVKVEINGTAGLFILDTGASFVSVQQDFAKRAYLKINPDSKIVLHTANGDTSGMLSKADSIKLGSLTAKNIPVVVQSSTEKLYGKAVDGLLGLSFLSRFEVQFASGFVEIRTRVTK